MKMLFMALFCCAVLGGCAMPFAHPPVITQGDVLARYGVPVDQWMLPDGSRVMLLVTNQQGYSGTDYLIGTDGIVTAAVPAADELQFVNLERGMTQDEVRRALGRGGELQRHPRPERDLWTWRYTDVRGHHRFFNAHFDASGRLEASSRTPEPERLSAR